MADEIELNLNININKGKLSFRQYPSNFKMTMTASGDGPYVGTLLIDTVGVDIDLSQLTDPGLCIIENQDATNYVDIGIYDPETVRFYPIKKILPGTFWPIYLSDAFGYEWIGTSTGTDTGPTNRLRGKANGASCKVSFKVFNK